MPSLLNAPGFNKKDLAAIVKSSFSVFLSPSLSSFLFSISVRWLILSLLNAQCSGFQQQGPRSHSQELCFSFFLSASLSLLSYSLYLSGGLCLLCLMLNASGFNSKGLAAIVKRSLSFSICLSLFLSFSLYLLLLYVCVCDFYCMCVCICDCV